ncbi:MAG: nitrogenase [Lachnospiraceae bacterium]|nr:nitrogenase [Lachnospiraceae bacterium]
MLQRVLYRGREIEARGAVVPIGEASFPSPFVSQLEFNAPVHGAWNIVHVGMLVPQCHQIYVCADNCMRGVVLTAAEMDTAGRFSCVLLEEADLFEENLETVTVEGVADAIERLPYRPRAVALFLVCLHHFLGTDTGYVYGELEKRFPDIDFMRCWMDPVMRKSGLSPEQKLKDAMFRPVRPLPVHPGMVWDIGDNQPLDPESDLAKVIASEGCTLFQLQDCRTYEDYLQIGASALLITRSPSGVHGASRLAARLGRPFLYLPPVCEPQEIREKTAEVRAVLEEIRNDRQAGPEKLSKKNGAGSPQNDAAAGGNTADPAGFVMEDPEKRALGALAHARALLGETEVTLDHVGTPRPLGLARLLLESGFHVTTVWLDAIDPLEEEDYHYLRALYPDLLLAATVHPKMRVLHAGENEGKMVAIGPKAAWFGGTRHFVNLVDFGGLWGFAGIEKLANLLEDAFLHEKDTRSIVPRKGFGCTCIFAE